VNFCGALVVLHLGLKTKKDATSDATEPVAVFLVMCQRVPNCTAEPLVFPQSRHLLKF
jgi:hypothetical protein